MYCGKKPEIVNWAFIKRYWQFLLRYQSKSQNDQVKKQMHVLTGIPECLRYSHVRTMGCWPEANSMKGGDQAESGGILSDHTRQNPRQFDLRICQHLAVATFYIAVVLLYSTVSLYYNISEYYKSKHKELRFFTSSTTFNQSSST
jgi:hypothetical protein